MHLTAPSSPLPETLPERIGCLRRHLVTLLMLWARSGRTAAIDSTVLKAKGGVSHKKDKQAGVVPHSSIDAEADWTYSGWHGWVYSWKLHLACSVAGVWIPLAAHLTPANVSDIRVAPHLIEVLPKEARFVLGDKHYNAKDLKQRCLAEGRFLVSSKRGAYPHADDRTEVRRIFHLLRPRAIENLNGHFKALFNAYGSVPTKGRADTARFTMGRY
jgi:Transposase DDE domain